MAARWIPPGARGRLLVESLGSRVFQLRPLGRDWLVMGCRRPRCGSSSGTRTTARASARARSTSPADDRQPVSRRCWGGRGVDARFEYRPSTSGIRLVAGIPDLGLLGGKTASSARQRAAGDRLGATATATATRPDPRDTKGLVPSDCQCNNAEAGERDVPVPTGRLPRGLPVEEGSAATRDDGPRQSLRAMPTLPEASEGTR